MLGVRFTGHRGLYVGKFADPVPKGSEVVLRVKASAICGTDREVWEGGGQGFISGHEVAGEVVGVDAPTALAVGDRVAVNCHIPCLRCEHCINGDWCFCPELECIGVDRHGGNAEYLLIPERSCMPLPTDLSYSAGALIVDALGTPYHAFKRLSPLPGDRVGIFGAGPIGLAALLVAKLYHCRVIAIDLHDYRLEMAQRLGADCIVNPRRAEVEEVISDWTDGAGLDAALECAGAEVTTRQSLDAVKHRGKVALIGVTRRVSINAWEQFIRREVTMFGSRNFNVREYAELVAVVRRGLPVEAIITHRFPLRDAAEAFALFDTHQCGKIILEP